MNKKFSTLVAGVLLAMGVGTVSAQTSSLANTSSTVKKLETGKSYILSGKAGEQLNVTKDGNVYKLSIFDSKNATLAEIDSALWTVSVIDYPNASTPTFRFVNKATGLPLSINSASKLVYENGATVSTDSITVGGDIVEWKYTAQTSYSSQIDTARLAAAFFSNDSSIVLGYNTSNKAVVAKIFANADVKEGDATSTGFTALAVAPYEAIPVYLNAGDLNTMMGKTSKVTDGWFTLNYTPELINAKELNIFKGKQLRAVPAMANNAAPVATDYTKAVSYTDSLYLIDKAQYDNRANNDNKYFVMVDTAYYNSANRGSKYRPFVYADTTKSILKGTNGSLPQFAFKFQYFPSSDSIAVYTSEAAKSFNDSDPSGYWKDITNLTPDTLVQIAVLTDKNHSEFASHKDIDGAGVRFYLDGRTPADLAEIPSDYYFIKNLNDDSQIITDKKKNYYFTVGLDSVMTYLPDANKNWYVSGQWIVNSNGGVVTSITNREYDNDQYTGQSSLPVGLFYKGEGYSADNLVVTDLAGNKYKFEKVTDVTVPAYYNKIEGDANYYKAYSLKYYTGFEGINAYVDAKDDKALQVRESENANLFFQLVPMTAKESDAEKFTNEANKNVKQLTRIAYKLRVLPSRNLAEQDQQWIVLDGAKYKLGKNKKDNAAVFYLKESTIQGNYVLIDTASYYSFTPKPVEANKVVVSDATSSALDLEFIKMSGRTSTFSLSPADNYIYRKLSKDDDLALFGDTVKFFDTKNPSRVLFEDSKNVCVDINNDSKENTWTGANYLGIFNEYQLKRNEAIFVDTAYVSETTMPQYLLAVRVNSHSEVECPADHSHPTTGEFSRTGWYLVNYVDSVADYIEAKKNPQIFQYTSLGTTEPYTRLGFVPAKHLYKERKLVIYDNVPVFDTADLSNFAKSVRHDTIDLSKNIRQNVTFQFRMVEDGNNDFVMESTNKTNPTELTYVKIHNGVPVLTDKDYDADVFNIAHTSEKPVANETIGATSVSVIAGNGDITIKGAAGKKVTISNVLGQTIANTVLSSDDATISTPAGVVVVAVEGEAAVKAIVK